jgi:hypothetical protein
VMDANSVTLSLGAHIAQATWQALYVWFKPQRHAGSAFQMSTAQRHSPSPSRRQMVTPRPRVVASCPMGPGAVTRVLAQQVSELAVG